MRRDEYEYELPDIGELSYLIELAIDNGMLTSWSEIIAWHQQCGFVLSGFELKTVRRISIIYNNAVAEFNGKDVPRPYYDKSKKRGDSSIKKALRG